MGDIPIIVTQNTMRGLYRVDAKGAVVPDLADGVSTSADGLVWNFKIKAGLLWSDGVALKAEHLAAGLRRLVDPKTASGYSGFLDDLQSAKATDAVSLEVRLKQPLPTLPAILTHWVTYPVRTDLIEKWGDYGSNPKHMAFLGAFLIDHWQRGLRIILLPNPNAEVKSFFEKVEAWIIADDHTAANLFQTRQLELVMEPSAWVPDAVKPHLFETPSPILYFLGIHASHPLTKKREGVMALQKALALDEVPKILGAAHRPAALMCPPEIWKMLGTDAPTMASLAAAAKDEDLGALDLTAQQWLARGGFADPESLPPLKLAYFERPSLRELAQWIQSRWKKELGIRVVLEGSEPKSYWKQLATNPTPVFLNSKGASYPDPGAFFDLFGSKNPQNLGRWKSQTYDGLIAAAEKEPKQEKRAELYSKALVDAQWRTPALIPLYYRSLRYLVQPYVKDLSINPLTSVDLARGTSYAVPQTE